MKEVSLYALKKAICDDYNLELNRKYKIYKNEFPIKNGKRKIKASNTHIIVDREGNEYPYMLNEYQRNDEKLVDFHYLYINAPKQLDEILKEANITLDVKPCRIDEGGGWYSKGKRYTYKDIYCEV